MTHQTYQAEERVGIWIDHNTAYFIRLLADHSSVVEKIDSMVGSRNLIPEDQKTSIKLAYSIFNKTYEEIPPQQHELHAFYKLIINRLWEIDYVYLFGPGEAKHGLTREIAKEGRYFTCKIVGVEPSAEMPQTQMELKAIEFFSSPGYADTLQKIRFASV